MTVRHAKVSGSKKVSGVQLVNNNSCTWYVYDNAPYIHGRELMMIMMMVSPEKKESARE